MKQNELDLHKNSKTHHYNIFSKYFIKDKFWLNKIFMNILSLESMIPKLMSQWQLIWQILLININIYWTAISS